MFRLLRKIAVGISICTALIATSPAAMAVEVYLFRGLAGVPFSVGLDDLGDKLKASGIHAETYGQVPAVQAMRQGQAVPVYGLSFLTAF